MLYICPIPLFNSNLQTITDIIYIQFLLLEKKKVQRLQTQVTVEQENSIGSRPGTSSRRMSNRSLNGSFGHASPVHRRLSPSIQQLELNGISSSTQGIPFIKERKKRMGQKMLSRPHLSSHFRDETASVVSTCSGPLSPWIFTVGDFRVEFR